MRKENRVVFASREEARTNGYRPCKICKPDAPDATPEIFSLTHYDCPLGKYILVNSKLGLVCLLPAERAHLRLDRWQNQDIEIQVNGQQSHEATRQLDAYFTGSRRQFTLSLDLRGTDFQRRVWQLLCQIPYGETRSYGEIARSLGSPGASRAVGRANGTNPVAIVVPCHRVIGADGSLTGYGGGLARKQALLDLEARVLAGKSDSSPGNLT